MTASIKSANEIDKMRIAGRLTAEVLEMIKEYVVPGVSTEELDRRCHDYIRKVQKATPANVGYHGFPKTLCTSVNGVVCHGIPSEKDILKDGDIVNIDVTVIKDGWHGDTSRMYYAGTPSPEAKRLVDATFDCMMAGIRTSRSSSSGADDEVAYRSRWPTSSWTGMKPSAPGPAYRQPAGSGASARR